jgi:hypothetical protein
LQTVLSLLNEVDGSKWANNGEMVVCNHNLCAFTQNSGGAPVSRLQVLAEELFDHGCNICGSIPLFYPGDNNVADGE